MAVINVLVEGDVDEFIATKIIHTAGHERGVVYGRQGYRYIKNKCSGFNAAAQGGYILSLVDLMDTGFDCPPTLIDSWLPNRHANFVFRVVVREIESWVLADSNAVARFLQINRNKIPSEVERLPDPKQTFINLIRNCRAKNLREEMVPSEGSTASVGKLYSSNMARFVRDYWNVEEACSNSASLSRCVQKLNEITEMDYGR